MKKQTFERAKINWTDSVKAISETSWKQIEWRLIKLTVAQKKKIDKLTTPCRLFRLSFSSSFSSTFYRYYYRLSCWTCRRAWSSFSPARTRVHDDGDDDDDDDDAAADDDDDDVSVADFADSAADTADTDYCNRTVADDLPVCPRHRSCKYSST